MRMAARYCSVSFGVALSFVWKSGSVSDGFESSGFGVLRLRGLEGDVDARMLQNAGGELCALTS